MRNDEAQIAVIFMFVIAVSAIGFYILVTGGIMDQVTVIHNNMTQGGSIPLTQDRQDAMLLTQGAFKVLPILAFILTIVVAVIFALGNRYQTV